jgi:16S rRNA (guanine1516-N2)-methyltransferase
VVANIQLVHADSAQYLEQQIQAGQQVDVIYLDPMFPQRDQNQQAVKKQAQVKKQMQLLHLLLPEDGEMDLGKTCWHWRDNWHKESSSNAHVMPYI